MRRIRLESLLHTGKERTLMSRFVDDGAGITFLTTVTIENKIVRLVRELEPENGVEFLVGALASVCTNDQLTVFAMNLEERATK